MSRWIVLVAVLTACEPLPPTSMAEIEFPEGFQLDTSTVVALAIDVPPGQAPDGRLVVRTPDGQPLYDGSVALAARAGLGLRVPATTAALEVVFRVDDVVLDDASIDVVDGRATWRLPEVR